MSDETSAQREKKRVSNPFLNTPQAAYYVSLSTRHLERLRRCGKGPCFRRHGRYVFYHIDDLDAWSHAHSSDNPDGR